MNVLEHWPDSWTPASEYLHPGRTASGGDSEEIAGVPRGWHWPAGSCGLRALDRQRRRQWRKDDDERHPGCREKWRVRGFHRESFPPGVHPQLMGGRWVGAPGVPCGVVQHPRPAKARRCRGSADRVAPACAPAKAQQQACSQFGCKSILLAI